MHTEPVTLINPFEVPAEVDAEQFIASWERARGFFRNEPDYRSTALHESITPDAEFRFVNVAGWQSADAFHDATGRMAAQGTPPFRAHPALYQIVREDDTGAATTAPVVFINLWESPASADEEMINAWERVRVYLLDWPGPLGSKLYRSIQPDADFRYVNVAGWQSPEAFGAAMATAEFRKAVGVTFPSHRALYRVVRT